MNFFTREAVDIPIKKDPENLNELRLYWLGQAGFLIDYPSIRIIIDPYLSDSLHKKYREAYFPHERMMPPPVSPGSIKDVDWVLSTHGHTDHMDPETLGPLFKSNGNARFLCPYPEIERAIERNVPEENIYGIDVDERLTVSDEIEVIALPSAHEKEESTEEGRHRYLGYILSSKGFSLYHSGDTLLFGGLKTRLRRYRPNLALLPINGRDNNRRSHGVPGNMNLEEALSLIDEGLLDMLIGHHYGLFDFNTINVEEAHNFLNTINRDIRDCFIFAELGIEYLIMPSTEEVM